MIMRNIFILPSEEPSKLQLQMNGKLHLEDGTTIALRDYQHLYITSDDKIEIPDWLIAPNVTEFGFRACAKADEGQLSAMAEGHEGKKIAFTTNPELIKDGVQEVPEWFLKEYLENPKDFVEVIGEVKAFDKNDFCVTEVLLKGDYEKTIYYIVLPEEPKFEVPDNSNVLKDVLETIENKERILEEAAGKCAVKENRSSLYELGMKYFISGAKWEQERQKELDKEITRLQEKYDENGYDYSSLIKLQRIDDYFSFMLKEKQDEKTYTIADMVAFAQWCVVTQAFGLYGFERAIAVWEKETKR
jgi:hypothetical protein